MKDMDKAGRGTTSDTKAAFLFPGQGAQYRGMGLDFYERSDGVRTLFALCSDSAGVDMKRLLETADDETLKRTDVSQPAITLVNLAAAALLRERGVVPVAVAGFSLGEYAALAASGVVSAEDCFRLVKERGRVMQLTADGMGCGDDAPGMAAVIGLAPETIAALLAEWRIDGLFAANINAPTQSVVSGSAAALRQAEPLFKAAGARRFIRLAVAGPFHSPLMADAAERFAPLLEQTPFHDPRIALYSNVTGSLITSGAEAKRLAPRHIVSPVQWVTEERALIARGGFDMALETGPGAVLAGLWRSMETPVPCRAAGTVQAVEGL
ncbi:MAG: ACP S-malonyltransferase [Treponema sp.]|jgi:[acyl-carrier-protein] S-malonyltransferase|nr:ACP S-malonyltransferase [Treponema sp.]